jgi:hypothetical protein
VGTQPLSITKTYGENATFSVSSPTQNVSFQWQVNLGAGFVNISNGGQYAGVTTSTLTISSVTVDNNSNQFRCILTTIEGCTAQSSNAVLTTLSPTSVSDLIGTTPEAYPNPTSSILFVPVNGKVVRVILSDITGKEVMDKLCPVGQSQIEMKVSTLKAGVYLLQTESKEGKSPIQKIVIQ